MSDGGPNGGSGESPIRRHLICATHGQRRWQGHVMCAACGRVFATQRATVLDPRGSRIAPEVCPCGQRLMPPASERRGDDALGLRTGGLFIDGEGHAYQGAPPGDWSARPICSACYRHILRRLGGRVSLPTPN